MLTVRQCDEILRANGTKLGDDEIKEVRDYLYFIASLQIEDNNRNKSVKCND